MVVVVDDFDSRFVNFGLWWWNDVFFFFYFVGFMLMGSIFILMTGY